MSFLSVTVAKDLGTMQSQGMIGLSPSAVAYYKKGRSEKSKEEHPVHLVYALYEQKQIDNPFFAIYLADEKNQSFLHIGDYNKTFVKNREPWMVSNQSNDGLFWFNSNSDNHWKADMDEAKMGEIPLELSVYKVMLDSGASLSYIPDPEFSIIVK